MSLRYKYLLKVSDSENNNKFYKMQENSDGTFTATYGRVGAAKPAIEIYSINKWESKLSEKLSNRKGYKDVTHLMAEIKTVTGLKKISDEPEVVSLITLLQEAANKTVVETYMVSSDKVTQAQIDEAQKILDNLTKGFKRHFGKKTWDHEAFNKELLKLYFAIPRKMKKVSDHVLSKDSTKSSIEEMIENEQSNLDTMASQVATNTATNDSENDNETLLKSLGLEITFLKDKSKFEAIQKLMRTHGSKLLKVFEVKNINSQKEFDEDLKSAKNKKTQLFFHGSRTQNWMSILQQSLKIRPSNAIHTGSLLGDAIYFADDDDKSMGYTDGGRWTGGGRQNNVFMGVYEVRIGNQLEMRTKTEQIYDAERTLFSKGYDSVFAHKGAYTGWANLRKNEFTIYKKEQCTIKYLLEIAV